MSLIPNRPTPEGRALGEQLARFADAADVEQRKQFPNMEERCITCAFRKGTLPNGCPETVMDALKCVLEGVDFICHHSPKDANGAHTGICMGWFLLSSQRTELLKAPWPFSRDEYSDEEREQLKRRSSKSRESTS